ncbi:MAG: OmpA family protein, partial [Chlorobi bacterium]|nr:OmpA family protein [Chlorobiota bacterium]
ETFGVIEGNGLRKLRTTISEYYRTQIPEYAELSSSISAVGITKDGKRISNPVIVIEEIETREDFPLLPYVFFQNGSSDLTKTVMKLRSKADYNELNLKDLPWNTLGIYSDLLNIVALRMNAYPRSSITITGCNNNTGIESKNIALSAARAAAVKKYLTEICGIDDKRIKTKSRNLPAQPGRADDEDGMAENSRVEISSNNSNILSPMSLSENQRTADPPTIEIIPSIKAEKDLKNWDIKVNQDDKIIREYSGEGMPETQIWQVEEGVIPEMEKPLGIVMNVEDEYGQTKRAETALNIKQLTIKKKRNILKNDKIVETFSLIVFDYNQAKIKPEHKSILNEIRSNIKANSKVTIAGYADRTGDAEYNRELAARRCGEVQKILKVKSENLTLLPIGNDELLYNNQTAEGRSYSRTVKIVIETPVGE